MDLILRCLIQWVNQSAMMANETNERLSFLALLLTLIIENGTLYYEKDKETVKRNWRHWLFPKQCDGHDFCVHYTNDTRMNRFGLFTKLFLYYRLKIIWGWVMNLYSPSMKISLFIWMEWNERSFDRALLLSSVGEKVNASITSEYDARMTSKLFP